MGIYLFLLALAGQVLIHYAWRAFRSRHHPGFVWFALLQVSIVFWIVCYLGEQTDSAHARFWFLLKFLGLGLVAPTWFLFLLPYTGAWNRSLRPWWPVLTWSALLPFVTLSNDRHHGFFREIVFRNELIGLNGPIFPFHVAWNYLLLLASTALLAVTAVRLPRKRRAMVALLVASLVPWSASFLNELIKHTPPGDPSWVRLAIPINPTLPAFIATAILFGWLVFRQRLLDPRPMARARLFAIQHEGMLVLDVERRVVDVNEAALKLLAPGGEPLLGESLESLNPTLSSALRAHELRKDGLDPTGSPLLEAPEGSAFEVRITTLKGEEKAKVGWLISLHDVEGERDPLVLEKLGLTARERELVEWVRQGLSNKEIATVLSIETSTVKNHLYNIFRKCGVSSRMELLRVVRGDGGKPSSRGRASLAERPADLAVVDGGPLGYSRPDTGKPRG